MHHETTTLGRLGGWAADHRKAIVITWVAIVMTLGALAPFADRALSGAGWEATGSESVAARHAVETSFPGHGSYALTTVGHYRGAAEWLGDTLLSIGVLIGFIVALALVTAGRPDLAAYVDPAMVVAVSVVFLRVPAALVAGGLREILSKAAPAGTLEELQACVDAVGQRFGLGESFLRAAKVGSRVDVDRRLRGAHQK